MRRCVHSWSSRHPLEGESRYPAQRRFPALLRGSHPPLRRSRHLRCALLLHRLAIRCTMPSRRRRHINVQFLYDFEVGAQARVAIIPDTPHTRSHGYDEGCQLGDCPAHHSASAPLVDGKTALGVAAPQSGLASVKRNGHEGRVRFAALLFTPPCRP